MEYIAPILAGIATILTAYFGYNQKTKDRLTELKIEKWKKEEEQKANKKSENVAKIYGVLWQLLHNLHADRVYIIQPHPLTNNLFLSISLEVKRNGVSEMKKYVQSLPMSEVAVFSAELSQWDFKYYQDIGEEVKDKRARALLSTNGSHSAIIRRLSNEEHSWIASIVCDFTRPMDVQPLIARAMMKEVAEQIQYILPEFKSQ